jgi:hypothetical protein
LGSATHHVRLIPFFLSYVRDHAYQRVPTRVLALAETLAVLLEVLQLLDFCFLASDDRRFV